VEGFSVSISIGGASLAPQELAAPQQKPAPLERVNNSSSESTPPRSSPPPGTGKVVDKTV
jgi:hypothetical protein